MYETCIDKCVGKVQTRTRFVYNCFSVSFYVGKLVVVFGGNVNCLEDHLKIKFIKVVTF